MVQFQYLPSQNREKTPNYLLSCPTRRARKLEISENTQIVYQRPTKRAELFLYSLHCLLYLHVNPVHVPDPNHL